MTTVIVGKASVTDELSGGYSYEITIPNTARERNKALPESMKLLLEKENEIKRLRDQLDAWAQKYADLKIKSDANQWAHDNMQDQLASANSKLKSSNWYLTHLLEQDCISDCSLVREVETLLSKQLEGKG